MADLPEGLPLIPDDDPTCRYVLHDGEVSLKPWAATELPEGLVLIDSLDDDCLTYEFYEDPENPRESAICEFVVRPDGCVEIASGGAPGVPVNVLLFIAVKADRFRFRKGD